MTLADLRDKLVLSTALVALEAVNNELDQMRDDISLMMERLSKLTDTLEKFSEGNENVE